MNTNDLAYTAYHIPQFSDLQCTSSALALAIYGHRNQSRSDGKLYITHPVRVVRLLQYYDIYDKEILDTAICHDLLEDTEVTEENIAYACRSVSVVNNVKMLTGVYYADKDTTKLTTEQKTELIVSKAASYNTSAALVKMADRLDNLTDAIGVWSDRRVAMYATQASLMMIAMSSNKNINFSGSARDLANKLSGVVNFIIRA